MTGHTNELQILQAFDIVRLGIPRSVMSVNKGAHELAEGDGENRLARSNTKQDLPDLQLQTRARHVCTPSNQTLISFQASCKSHTTINTITSANMYMNPAFETQKLILYQGICRLHPTPKHIPTTHVSLRYLLIPALLLSRQKSDHRRSTFFYFL